MHTKPLLDTQRKELRKGKRGDHYGMVIQFPTTATKKRVVFWKNELYNVHFFS
jgi:hypothetical protein